MDAIVDIYLMSIDTLVSLSVDTKNKINLIASTSLTDWNEVSTLARFFLFRVLGTISADANYFQHSTEKH